MKSNHYWKMDKLVLLPGFKTTTTIRSSILDAVLQSVFYRLKDRYSSRRLDTLASISSGGTPSRSDSRFFEGDIPWAKISDISSAGKWIHETEEHITQSAINNSSAKLFPTGTVLFSLYGSIGKTSIVTRPLATNQAILGLIPSNDINSEYLYYALINARTALFAHSQGTSQKNINGRMVKEFEIPIPPKTEVNRIIRFLSFVEEGQNTSFLHGLPNYLSQIQSIMPRIEMLSAKVNEVQKLKLDADKETVNIFINSISNLPIKEQFWKNVGSVLVQHKRSIHSGPFGSDLTHDEFINSGVAAIGTRDVQVNNFELNSGWFVSIDRFKQLKQYQIFPGDVLVTIIGGSIGRFCVVPDDVPLAFTTKHVIAICFDPIILNPRFASYMLNFHSRCRKSIFSQTAGSAQPSLNITKVKAIEIPAPPMSSQIHFLQYIDKLHARINILQHLQSETQKELDLLMPSILDLAFIGERS